MLKAPGSSRVSQHLAFLVPGVDSLQGSTESLEKEPVDLFTVEQVDELALFPIHEGAFQYETLGLVSLEIALDSPLKGFRAPFVSHIL